MDCISFVHAIELPGTFGCALGNAAVSQNFRKLKTPCWFKGIKGYVGDGCCQIGDTDGRRHGSVSYTQPAQALLKPRLSQIPATNRRPVMLNTVMMRFGSCRGYASVTLSKSLGFLQTRTSKKYCKHGITWWRCAKTFACTLQRALFEAIQSHGVLETVPSSVVICTSGSVLQMSRVVARFTCIHFTSTQSAQRCTSIGFLACTAMDGSQRCPCRSPVLPTTICRLPTGH